MLLFAAPVVHQAVVRCSGESHHGAVFAAAASAAATCTVPRHDWCRFRRWKAGFRFGRPVSRLVMSIARAGNDSAHDNGPRAATASGSLNGMLPTTRQVGNQQHVRETFDEQLIRLDPDALGITQKKEELQSVNFMQSRGTLRRLISHVLRLCRKHAVSFVPVYMALLVICLSKVCNLLKPLVFKLALDTLAVGGPRLSLSPTVTRSASGLMAAYGLLRMLGGMLHEARNVFMAKFINRAGRLFARDNFEHVLALEPEFHLARKAGDLVELINDGADSFASLCRLIVLSFFPTVLEFILVCGVLLARFGPYLVTLTVVTFGLFLGFTFFVNNALGITRKIMQGIKREMRGRMTDSVFGIEFVQQFANETLESKRLDACLSEYERNAVKNEYQYSMLNAGQSAVFAMGFTAVLVLITRRIGAGALTVGDLLMVTGLMEQLWVPLNFLGWQYRELKQALISAENVLEILDRPARIRDAPDAKPLQVGGAEIVFDNVCFSYDEVASDGEDGVDADDIEAHEESRGPAGSRLLKNLSFRIPAGSTVAIVGASGSGKSSVIKLLQRMYQADSGSIKIDGQDISNVTLHSLRTSMGVIPQDSTLFNDTIFYNIAYGCPERATPAEIERVAKLARIHDTIAAMPMGYQTHVGNKGIRLSGGERQRVSIARCLLRNPKILICDEATSALDSETEREITEALKRMEHNRTSVLIAHRLSTIRHADRILVMKSGQIVEAGTYAELKQNPSGVFNRMLQEQEVTSKKPLPEEDRISRKV
ncbi:ATP-binding cassette sub-family B member 7, mitochondrial [Porphyridium purpureum]|uniref:Probable ATP-dependent transporter ycf16 n=1 Tax=Porphyridium purpureum TaxID=35688 RepID=A0A5J4Z105_PORPP|nr:ATP-binding cassette sub-family B member 7, mitochondrial [Porphyridium purpureum]|eukprot:POR8581..scf208_2